jgi:hypothetical protein
VIISSIHTLLLPRCRVHFWDTSTEVTVGRGRKQDQRCAKRPEIFSLVIWRIVSVVFFICGFSVFESVFF